MAPPHTMSPSKSRRPGPAFKPLMLRSIAAARVNRNASTQSSRPQMPGLSDSIVDQFRLQRQRQADDSSDLMNQVNEEKDKEETRRRISYTKEQKLGAISYATTTWKTQKDGSQRLISKYAAAKDLGITPAMLWDWLKQRHNIELMTRGTRKFRVNNNTCQEPEMEACLTTLFNEVRKVGRKINKRWFIRYAKKIYGELHPDRVIETSQQLTQYTEFAFSQGRFNGFKRRHCISVRAATKVSQMVGKKMRFYNE